MGVGGSDCRTRSAGAGNSQVLRLCRMKRLHSPGILHPEHGVQIIARPGIVGVQLQDFLKLADRLIELPFHAQRNAQVVSGHDIIRLQPEWLPETG